MKHFQQIDRLCKEVRSMLTENRYEFSEADMALLEEILVELEDASQWDKSVKDNHTLEYLSLLLRFLQFFGIDKISDWLS